MKKVQQNSSKLDVNDIREGDKTNFLNAILVCASHKEPIVGFDWLYLKNIWNFLNFKKHVVA